MDRDVGPDPADEPHQRARLRLGGARAGRGSSASNGRPPPRQRNGKLRLRSTPRAFWRVPRAHPVGVERCAPSRPARRPAARAARSRRDHREAGGLGAVDRAGDEHAHGRVGAARCTATAHDRRMPRTRSAPRRGAAASSASGCCQGGDAWRRRSQRGEQSPCSVPRRCSVVIVGAGTFGASLAWTLARAGEDVALVDQFEPGDARATSGGESRLIRCAPRRRRGLHGVRPPRAHALARARGRDAARS